MDGGAYLSEARSWGEHPTVWADGRQGMVAGLTPQERGRVLIKAKIDIRWAH